MKFDTFVLGEPYQPTGGEQKACKALWEYSKQVTSDKPDNHLFRKLAKEYGTTSAAMNRHWKCVESRYKCYDC